MMEDISFYRYLIIIMLLTFMSCGSHKTIPLLVQNSVENQDYNVIILIKTKVPYCGGAYPSPEQINKTEIEKHSDFIIQYKENYGDSMWYKEYETDSTGKLQLFLPEGRYCLKRSDKKKSFGDFYKFHKKEDNAYNIYGDSACYYQWWKSCSLEFELNKEKSSIDTVIIINSRCFSGEDPCHNYIGPYPP